jgi:cytochrome P450
VQASAARAPAGGLREVDTVRQQEAVDLSALQPEYGRDPYPIYARFRETEPVRPILLYGFPAWLVTRYEDVRQALVDPRLSSDMRTASPAVREAAPWMFAHEAMGMGRQMIQTDPPDHTRLRRLISGVFTPGRVEALRPRVQQIANDLLAGFTPRGRADLVDEFAHPLPLLVIVELLGLPTEDQTDITRWSKAWAQQDPALIFDATARMRDYLAGQIERRRGQDREDGEAPDLLTALIAHRDQGERLSEEELLSMTMLMMAAGHETTVNLISSGTLALLRNPDVMAALRADHSLIGRAVEEFLRYDGPAELMLPRWTKEEVRIGDVVIPGGGEAVMLCLAAADRDPTRFANPDQVDLGRDTTGHLGFGHGIHFCLGSPLARMEGQIAFRTLLERCVDLALAVDPADLTWRASFFGRGVTHLPVTFQPEVHEPGPKT